MTNDIIFRKGTVEDIPAFLAFFKTSIPMLFPEYSSNSANYIVDVDYGPSWATERLTKGNKQVYLAFRDQRVVGYLFVAKSIAGVSFADWLGVDTNFQKRGIATHLLSLWEQEALAEGAHSLQLWTSKKDVEFYVNRGFSHGGLFPKAWYGEDSYLIYKIISKPDENNFLKDYFQRIKKG